jgi:hypothetical protein
MSDTTIPALAGAEDNITESWVCIDYGINTAPGIPDGPETRRQFEALDHIDVTVNRQTEVYYVRDAVWARAGMEPFGGCLCVGCLERRLGRKLKPKDFLRSHPFNGMTGSERLLKRRKYWHSVGDEQ